LIFFSPRRLLAYYSSPSEIGEAIVEMLVKNDDLGVEFI